MQWFRRMLRVLSTAVCYCVLRESLREIIQHKLQLKFHMELLEFRRRFDSGEINNDSSGVVDLTNILALYRDLDTFMRYIVELGQYHGLYDEQPPIRSRVATLYWGGGGVDSQNIRIIGRKLHLRLWSRKLDEGCALDEKEVSALYLIETYELETILTVLERRWKDGHQNTVESGYTRWSLWRLNSGFWGKLINFATSHILDVKKLGDEYVTEQFKFPRN